MILSLNPFVRLRVRLVLERLVGHTCSPVGPIGGFGINAGHRPVAGVDRPSRPRGCCAARPRLATRPLGARPRAAEANAEVGLQVQVGQSIAGVGAVASGRFAGNLSAIQMNHRTTTAGSFGLAKKKLGAPVIARPGVIVAVGERDGRYCGASKRGERLPPPANRPVAVPSGRVRIACR